MHLLFFFFTATATTEIYTLSLHDALPILNRRRHMPMRRGLKKEINGHQDESAARPGCGQAGQRDRKSTRLNSSHPSISYAVFCLKKKKKKKKEYVIQDKEYYV